MIDLLHHERQQWQNGRQIVAGVDEAGRGPLAGPVVAAAVVFPPSLSDTFGINDSKKLSPKNRERLKPLIEDIALAIGVGIVDHIDIDRINILQATYKAMQIAVQQLSFMPDFVLIDGRGIPDLEMPCESIIKGDSKSVSIAAASIIAKVTRDHIMIDMHEKYPHYGFTQHKGYGTKKHIQAIREHGLSPIHRRSFRPRALMDIYDDLE
jgi:ribonuclease HII